MSQRKNQLQNEEFKFDQTISEEKERERERERERESEKESSERKEETKGSSCQFPTTSLRKKLAWPDEICQWCYTVRSLACWCSPQNNGTMVNPCSISYETYLHFGRNAETKCRDDRWCDADLQRSRLATTRWKNWEEQLISTSTLQQARPTALCSRSFGVL